MLTQQAQIKLNLPIQLKEYLESRAGKFGMPLAGYLKHLILKDVAEMDYPVFEASEKTIKAYNRAISEKDKATEVTDVDEFF